jgi:N-acetylglucosamine kinase-like BadF-type ATPase
MQFPGSNSSGESVDLNSVNSTGCHYYAGVDGGGSKTLAVVVDAQGHERGHGMAGSANHTAVGLEQAVAHICAAVEEATRTADCHLPLHAAWLGIAGIDRPADYAMLFPHIRGLAAAVHLTNDAELPLSALDGTVGVALIAGTGSIALGRDQHGTTARAGDQVARKIVQQAAGELALAVVALSSILDFTSTRVPLALAGGLLVHETDFRSQVLRRIHRQRSIGQIAVVEHPALSAAHAAVHLVQ